MEYKWIFVRDDNGERKKVKCFIVPKKNNCKCKPKYKIVSVKNVL